MRIVVSAEKTILGTSTSSCQGGFDVSTGASVTKNAFAKSAAKMSTASSVTRVARDSAGSGR